jgi:hypothetical protein
VRVVKEIGLGGNRHAEPVGRKLDGLPLSEGVVWRHGERELAREDPLEAKTG